jgi:hypothetical protein
MIEKPWLCSMRGVDWLSTGCPGRSLEVLRSHFGLEDGHHHRAVSDADATLRLLSLRDPSGRPFFGQLLDRLPQRIAELENRPDHTQATMPRVAFRYRRRSFETITERFAAGPVMVTSERSVVRQRDPGPATRELMDLLSGIVADGTIDIDEFRILDTWLMRNSDLSGEFPFNVLATQLSKILEDGGVQFEELQRLQDLVLQILHPQSLGFIDLSAVQDTPLTQPAPRISFPGKIFVFTGEFYFGGRPECEQATTERGAICKPTITRKTDYLVVGGQGSQDWICGSYGTKIEKAVANVRNGSTTAIISEAHWVSALYDASSTISVPARQSNQVKALK